MIIIEISIKYKSYITQDKLTKYKNRVVLTHRNLSYFKKSKDIYLFCKNYSIFF
jgi:hypothetical protein